MKKDLTAAGPARVGPSTDYLNLIRGKISPKQYVDKVSREVTEKPLTPRQPGKG